MRNGTGAVAAPKDVATIYRELKPLLIFIAFRKFNVPCDEAETLVHDVILMYISCDARITDPRAWLIGAVCNASRHYFRKHGREFTPELDDRLIELMSLPTCELEVERIERAILVRQVLARLPARHRNVLRLHYLGQMTEVELANHFETTVRYAQKMIGVALRQARELFGELRRSPSESRVRPRLLRKV